MSDLQIDGLSHRYPGGPEVLDRVSFSAPDASITCVLGPSGSGKSTVLGCVAGLVRPDRGRVIVGGADVTDRPPHRRPVTLLMQQAVLFEHLTVGENVEFPLRVRGNGRASRRARSTELLDLVGIADLADRHPATLSGGQQQRVAFARALATGAEVLLADEPFASLDTPLRRELQDAVRDLQRATGTTVLFVTHDLDEAFALADRLVVVDRGAVRGVGTSGELLRRPADRSVARLLGVDNLLTGEDIDPGRVSCPPGELRVDPAARVAASDVGRSTWAIHPDHVELIDPNHVRDPGAISTGGSTEWTGIITDRRRGGTRSVVHIDAAGTRLTATVPGHDVPDLGATVHVRLPIEHLSEISDG